MRGRRWRSGRNAGHICPPPLTKVTWWLTWAGCGAQGVTQVIYAPPPQQSHVVTHVSGGGAQDVRQVIFALPPPPRSRERAGGVLRTGARLSPTWRRTQSWLSLPCTTGTAAQGSPTISRTTYTSSSSPRQSTGQHQWVMYNPRWSYPVVTCQLARLILAKNRMEEEYTKDHICTFHFEGWFCRPIIELLYTEETVSTITHTQLNSHPRISPLLKLPSADSKGGQSRPLLWNGGFWSDAILFKEMKSKKSLRR